MEKEKKEGRGEGGCCGIGFAQASLRRSRRELKGREEGIRKGLSFGGRCSLGHDRGKGRKGGEGRGDDDHRASGVRIRSRSSAKRGRERGPKRKRCVLFGSGAGYGKREEERGKGERSLRLIFERPPKALVGRRKRKKKEEGSAEWLQSAYHLPQQRGGERGKEKKEKGYSAPAGRSVHVRQFWYAD